MHRAMNRYGWHLAILLAAAAVMAGGRARWAPGSPPAPAARDSIASRCLVVDDSATGGRSRVYLRLDAGGRVAFSTTGAPASASERDWMWQRIGDTAVVTFRGIDSGEQLRIRVGVPGQRAPRVLWWANEGGGERTDSVGVRVVACPERDA